MTNDERVKLRNEGRISALEFVMLGDDDQRYLDWCIDRGIDPSPESAEFFIAMTDAENPVMQEAGPVDVL